MPKFIRTSKHSLKFSNTHKLEELNSFIQEYKRIAKIYLDYIWNNNFSYSYSKNNKIFTTNFNNNTKLDLPNRLSTVNINKKLNLKTTLTARSLQCCLNQVLAIIRGDVEKQRKRQYIVNKLRSQSKKIPKKLRKATKNNKPVKPDLSDLKPELNINCVDFREDNSKKFNSFIQLRCFTKTTKNKTINFPIKYHKVSNKWRNKGKRLNSFLFSPNSIDIRYEIEKTIKKDKKGKIVGGDQGIRTVLTFSDKQVTTVDSHKHSLESITRKLSRKKKGSKAFGKAQEHRKNFINWSINKLNFSDIKEIRFEKIKSLRYKRKTSRYLSHWTYTEIKDKLERKCEEEEVLLSYQSSVYRSQRCNNCGLVLKSNRNNKTYLCKNCGLEIDADLNASLNHQQDLPDISYDLRKLNLNRLGFFWKSDGFYNLTGEKLTVSLPKKLA